MEETDSCQKGGGGGEWWEEGEGTSYRTCMNDSRTWTSVWGLTVGAGRGLGGGGQRGKNWDNSNRINKYKKRNLLFSLSIS